MENIKTKKNKILVLSLAYPNKYNSYSGIFAHQLNRGLLLHGFEIKVVYLHDVGPKEWLKYNFKKVEQNDLDGISISMKPYRVLKPQSLPRLNFYNYKKNVLNILNNELKDFIPDLILSHFSVFSGIMANDLSDKLNVPYITIEHHSIFSREMKGYLIKKVKNTIEHSSMFVAVSNGLKNKIIEKTNVDVNKITVVPNMISSSFKFFGPIKKNIFTFISVGSLKSNKNNVLLVESFINTFSKNEDVELKIIGSGPEFITIKEIIEKNKREHQIKLLGALDEEKLALEYEKSNCLVSLSKFETFGIVFREANIVGRPVISYMNEGIQENWTKDLGIIIEDLESSTIRRALTTMIKNYDNYDFKRISEYTHNLYSSEIISNYYNKQINKIIEEGS